MEGELSRREEFVCSLVAGTIAVSIGWLQCSMFLRLLIQ